MIVVLTYKCKREEDSVSMPEGLRVLPLLGYSSFEHTLNALDRLNVSKLYIMTDGFEDAFENHSAYLKAQEKYPCSVIHVEPGFNWHDKSFFSMLSTAASDVLWLCGDMFLYAESLYRLGNGEKSTYIEIYSSSNIKQHDPKLRFADYLKSYATVYQNGGTNADTIPAAFFRAGDFKKLLSLSNTLQDGQSIMDLPLSKKNLKTLGFLFSVFSLPSCLAVLLSSVESEETLSQLVFHSMLLQQTRVSGNNALLRLQRQLTSADKDTILYVRNLHSDPSHLVFDSVLAGTPTVVVDELQDTASIPQTLAQHFGQKYPSILICCGDEKAYAYANAVYRHLLAEVPEDQYPHIVHIPTVSAIITPFDFSWLATAPDTLISAYLRNAWNVCNLSADVDLTPAVRVQLYAFTLANCLNVLFSKNEEPFLREYAKVILHRFFRMSGTSAQIIMMAIEANTIAALCGNTVVNAFAHQLTRNSDLSYGEAMLYALASINLFTEKNIKKDFAGIARKVLTDNLDEMLISAGLNSADEFFAITLAMLKLNDKVVDGTQMSAAASALLQNLTGAEQENSLYVPNSKTLQGICALAENTTAFHKTYLTEKLEEATSNPDLVLTPSIIRNLKTPMQSQVLIHKYHKAETELYHTVHTFCTENGIDYWLLRCGAELEADTLKQPCMVILKPWDLEQFSNYIATGACDGLGLERNYTSDPNIFADAYLYKEGTFRENRWNLNATSARNEIGIPILAALPHNGNISRFKLANALNRIICLRSGYYIPSLTKSQKLINIACRFLSTDTLKRYRDRLLKRPTASDQAWQKLAYLDLHHVATVALDTTAAETVCLYGDDHPVIDAPDYVFTQGKKLLNTFYRPINTAYRIRYGATDTYALRTPDIKPAVRVSLIKRVFGKLYRTFQAVVKKAVGAVRKGFKRLTEAMKPVKAKLNLWRKLVNGSFRGMGICLSAHSKELKKYRNKYAGQRCFLIGNGPSLRAEDLDALSKNGEITFACNFIHRIYNSTDWRPTYHFISDSSTVRTACWDIVRNIDPRTTMVIRDFAYDKMTIKPAKALVPHSISLDDYKVSKNFLAYHYISHATVMSMMLECAMYMGFSEIYLIGVDATTSSDKGGNFAANYYTPEQRASLDIQKRKVIKNYNVHARRREIALRQKNVYGMLAQAAEKRNIHIYNATRGGALEAYPRVNLDDLLDNP